MPFDQGLHERVLELLNTKIDFTFKKMFGGICYLTNGNMLGGIINDELIVRAGKNKHDELLEEPYTRVFDITGKVMKGWILVEPKGIETDEQLDFWLLKGIDFAGELPGK